MLISLSFLPRSTSGAFLIGPTVIAPDNVNPLNIGETSIEIAWNDNSPDETGFEVWSSTDGASYSLLDSVDPGETSYLNSGLTANTRYYYQVRAIKGAQRSAFSTPISFDTPPAGPLYLSFKVKFDASELAADGAMILYCIDTNSGSSITLRYNKGPGQWAYTVNGTGGTYVQALVADTYVTVDLKMDYSTPGSLTLTPRFDGTPATPVTEVFIAGPRELLIGAVDSTGAGSNRTFDDVKLGHTGYGSSEYLSAAFAATIVPPFDSIVDQQGSKVVVASAAMHVFPDATFQGYASFGIVVA